MRIICEKTLNEVINLTATDPPYEIVSSMKVEDTYLSNIRDSFKRVVNRNSPRRVTVATLADFCKTYTTALQNNQIYSPEQYQLLLTSPSKLPKLKALTVFPLNYFNEDRMELLQNEISNLPALTKEDRIDIINISYYLCLYLRDIIHVLSDKDLFTDIMTQKFSYSPERMVSPSTIAPIEVKMVIFHNLQAIKLGVPDKILS